MKKNTTNFFNEMKQTAVEWLVSKILTEVQNYEDGDIETELERFKHEYVNKFIGMVDLSEFVNKAKAMEKEQIIQAITKTIIGSNVIYDNEYPEVIHTAEQYYKEIYESKTNL